MRIVEYIKEVAISFDKEENPEATKDEYSKKPSGFYYSIAPGDDPHEVQKLKKRTNPDHMSLGMVSDGHTRYLETVQGLDNPFFPKVYSLEPEIVTERLMSYSELSLEAILSQFRYFNKLQDYSSPEQIVKLIAKDTEERGWDVDYDSHEFKREVSGILAAQLDYVTRTSAWKRITDSNLLEALQLIKKLHEETDSYLDLLNESNIMYRGSPVGPQMVLNDPLTGF